MAWTGNAYVFLFSVSYPCNIILTYLHFAGYEEHIQKFKESFLSLDISVTPTVHTIFKHIKGWYDRHGLDHGLAWYGEEALETAHNDWPKTWVQGYQVPDTHPEYGSRLKAGVSAYNTQRK